MSLHLSESITDFGGVYSTWLFSFERFNGYLGDTQTNNKGIEVTLMRKVLADCSLANKCFEIPKDFFDSCSLPPSKKCIFKPAEMKHISLQTVNIPTLAINDCTQHWSKVSHIIVPDGTTGPVVNAKYLHRIDEDEVSVMCDMYKSMYAQYDIQENDLGTLARRFSTITIGSERFCTDSVSELKTCLVLAKWANDFGEIDGNSAPRLGLIKYFLQHGVCIEGEIKSHMLCAIDW